MSIKTVLKDKGNKPSFSCLRLGLSLLLFWTLAARNPLSLAHAALPQIISFQGRLTDANNNPKTGQLDMSFAIFDAFTNGNQIWTENQNNVNIVNGVFSVQLGSIHPLSGAFTSDLRYLEIKVGGETLAPRERLVSAPYAINASSSENSSMLGGLDAGVYATKQYVNGFGGAALLSSANTWTAQQTFMGGNVGIGTTVPGGLLDVAGGTGPDMRLMVGAFAGADADIYNLGVAVSNSRKITMASLQGSFRQALVFGDSGSGNNEDTIFGIASDSGGGFTGKLVVKQGGNVGVGTTAPGELVDIVKSQNLYTRIHIYNPNGGNIAASSLSLGNNTNSQEAEIFLNGSGNFTYGGANSLNLLNVAAAPIAFFTNNMERVRIDGNTGNVGIGTMTPGSVLHVAGATSGVSGYTARITDSNGSIGATLLLGWTGAFADAKYKAFFANSNGLNFGTVVDALNAEPVSQMVLKTNGNVGIGTTGPIGLLHLVGDGKNLLRLEGTPSGLAQMLFRSATDTVSKYFFMGPGYNTANVFSFGSTDSGATLNVTQTGNVGIGTANPKAKLEVAGDFIRTIPRAAGYGQDGLDTGQIVSRVVTAAKKQADTGVRVTYVDNLRSYGQNSACRWEIRFDGNPCANPGPLVYDFYSALAGENTHESRTLIGTCFGLGAGNHQVQIWVGQTPGYTDPFDCHTGWNNQYWTLEAEEVR